MARPARVRIRSRKPCTRARRRLFGWKVRLPLATTASSMHLASQSAHSPTWIRRGRRMNPDEPWRTRCLAGSRRGLRTMPGSQPHRQRSGDCMRVLRTSRLVKRGRYGRRPTARRLTHATSATPPIALLSSNFGGMLQNGWHSERKLLASCNAVSARNGARQRSEDGGSAIRPGGEGFGCLEHRSRMPSSITCGAVMAALSTPVDKCVDSASSPGSLYLERE